jgi:hypothetical protein
VTTTEPETLGTVACAECRQPFERKQRIQRRRRFCSPACRYRSRDRRRYEDDPNGGRAKSRDYYRRNRLKGLAKANARNAARRRSPSTEVLRRLRYMRDSTSVSSTATAAGVEGRARLRSVATGQDTRRCGGGSLVKWQPEVRFAHAARCRSLPESLGISVTMTTTGRSIRVRSIGGATVHRRGVSGPYRANGEAVAL